MQQRIIAFSLVILCFVCAIGNIVIASMDKTGKAVDVSDEGWKPYAGNADIAIIDVTGTIVNNSEEDFINNKYANSTNIVNAMEKASKNNVKGMLVRINSPGGTASGSQAVYSEILKLRARGIKVVTLMGDVAASGGYYIASASDKIMAYPSTLTGSIGVISYVQNFKGLMNKIGVNTTVIKSGPHKDIGSPFREMTADEKAIFQEIIDDTYNLFLDAVANGRKMDKAKVKKLADGRIYTAHKAVAVGLIDTLGGYDDAINMISKMANIKKQPKVYNYTKNRLDSIFDKLLGLTSMSSKLSAILPENEYLLKNFHKIPLMLADGYSPIF